MNRQQRRSAERANRKRGVGYTRQYTSKRARETYGVKPRAVVATPDFNSFMEALKKMNVNADDDLGQDDLPTEEYDDYITADDDIEGVVEEEAEEGEVMPYSLNPFNLDITDEVVYDPISGEWGGSKVEQWKSDGESLIKKFSTSNVKEVMALIRSGECDDHLQALVEGETAARNRVTVIRALESRMLQSDE